MSSKAKRRRRAFEERERERKRRLELEKPWRCVCGLLVASQFPICLCGRLRGSKQ